MNDGPIRHLDGRLDRKSLARMSEAFSLLTEIYRHGGWGSVERGSVRWTDAPEGFQARASLLDAEIRSLIQGPTVKDWAKGRRDVALAFIRDGAEISKLGAIELMERRIIGRMRVFDMGEDGRKAFSAFMADAVGILVSGPDHQDRAAIGRLCAEAGIGRGKLEIIEAESRRKPQDYRNYLAGSFWIDMNEPPESDIVAHALLTALQVRSTRKLAMTFHKQGFYTALAVSAAASAGMSSNDIASAFHLNKSLVDGWLDAGRPARADASSSAKNGSPAPAPSVPRAPSPKQMGFVNAILGDLPWLSAMLPEGWRDDGAAVSLFLSRVQDGGSLAARRAAGRDIQRGRALREALADGAGLEEAALAAGIGEGEFFSLLRRHFAADAAALGDDLSRMAGIPIIVT